MDECPVCHQALASDADMCGNCRTLLGSEEASPSGAGLDEQLLELLRAGGKIDAIKLYRQQTRAGLTEATDAVEALAAKHGVAPQ